MISYSLSDLNDDEKIKMLKKEINFTSEIFEKIDWLKIKEKKKKYNRKR